MPTFHLFETLSIAFLLQAVLYLIFLTRAPKSKANIILIAFISILVLGIVNLFFRFLYPGQIFYLYFESVALLAPLQYLYVSAVINQKFRFNPKQLYHLTGFIIVVLLRLLFLFQTNEFSNTLFEKYLSIPLFLYTYSYLFLSIRNIRHFHEAILLTQSTFEKLNLKWLKYELIILGFYFATLGVESIALFTDLGDYYELVVFLAFLNLLLFINVLTFKSLRIPSSTKGITEEDLEIVYNKKVKYKGSSLTSDESKQNYRELVQLVDEQKPFLQYDLSLNELAKLVKKSSAVISQVINENAKMNFNDFINQYRIEEAKKLLSDPNNDLLIKEIMYNSGFQSTSTFNDSFKKNTGFNPSAFRKMNKK